VTSFRTTVSELLPSPRGLIASRWVMEHWCRTCHRRVRSDELVTHAGAHEADVEHEGGTIE
jgi:hypothetical protein